MLVVPPVPLPVVTEAFPPPVPELVAVVATAEVVAGPTTVSSDSHETMANTMAIPDEVTIKRVRIRPWYAGPAERAAFLGVRLRVVPARRRGRGRGRARRDRKEHGAPSRSTIRRRKRGICP